MSSRGRRSQSCDDHDRAPEAETNGISIGELSPKGVSLEGSSRPLGGMALALIALAATWTAGFVDAAGFLLLSDILTANMSGNTVRIGVSAVTANGFEALHRGWPVLMFVTGLVASAIIHETGVRKRFISTSAVTFGIESGLLLSVQGLYLTQASGLSQGTIYLVTAGLLAFAMGIQNATVTRVGALSVKTTHVTGTLTKFAEGFSQAIFWTWDQIRANTPHHWKRVLTLASHEKPFREAGLMLLLWIAFLIGSICGVASRISNPRFLFVPPAVVALVLAVVDVVRPIAASDEHHSSRSAG